MLYLHILSSILFLLLGSALSAAPPVETMTWNIKWFPGGHPEASETEKSHHLKAAQKILESSNPDIFLAQEINDEKAIKHLIKNVPGMKLHVITTFPNFDDSTPASQQCAIASKLKAHSAWFEPFETVRNLPSLQRGFAFAALEHADGGLIMVYCIHLKSNHGNETPEGAKNNAATRAEAIRQIIAHKKEMIRKFSNQKILGWVIGGDFNSNHDNQFPLCTAIQDLAKAGFHNSWDTTPLKDRLTWRNNPRFEDYPATTFDYIMTSGFPKTQAKIIPNVPLKISDHAPVILELSMPR